MTADLLAPLQFIGGSGGSQHKVKGWERGQRIRKIEVFVGGSQIKAIRLWLTGDGDYQEFGRPGDHPSKEFTFQDDEQVTSMSLWGNGVGTRAGAIKFKTSLNRTFDYGMTGRSRKKEYKVDVGSGIMVGAIYNAGEDIDAQGYYFLSSSVLNGHLGSLKYGSLNGRVEPETLDSFAQTNRSSGPVSWTFSGEKEVILSKKWTSSTEQSFKVTEIAGAEVPSFSLQSSFEWETRQTSSYDRETTERKTLSWSNSGQLRTNESISLTAITRKGTLSVPYTATVTINLTNGSRFEFLESGTFTGIAYTSVEIQNT
ncbi:hypothetical protein KP509_02G024700 [Ceratopteris richardii]|uniref:Jacalin-type lectin domain-containing protein n=1 Tax=Ceratopteris richardii TaxID=49495 RepID=A0A8T2VFD5_CERRI|nr:hypothetical protein KP509_02G024700 [Ceratopteris richardii]